MAKIVIIGGGVSGLSAGIYAQLSGHEAVVCERQAMAGGNLTGWQRGEYHIDNCIHWLTGTNPASDEYKTWTELGALGGVAIHQPDSLYTYEEDGKQLSLSRNLSVFREEMLKISPADEKEILALCKAIERIQEMWGIGGENHDEKSSRLQDLLKLPFLVRYYRWTTGDLAKRFQNPFLQNFITSMLGDKFASLALLIVAATFCGDNGGIPKGSSLAMAKRMSARFLSLGGKLRLKCEAEKIETENGKATAVFFSNGEKETADYVVIACDPAVVFKKMLDIPLPKQLEKQYSNPAMPRFSSYQCALACDEKKLPFTHDFIFRLPAKHQKKLHSKTLILREFSHEKSFAPKGKSLLQTLTFCTEKESLKFIKLRKDKPAYDEKKKQIADTMVEIITEKFPQLKGKLHPIDVWTPATYKRYTDSETGSYMSFLLPPNIFPKAVDNRVKSLKNVFLATQWQQAPGGLPIAAKVGKRVIERINRKEKVQK